MEKSIRISDKKRLLDEAKTITEGLINNFDEFYRFNKNTFHENYYSSIESLIAQIEPQHFTKRNPAFLKIKEQAFSHIHSLKEFSVGDNRLKDLNALIHTIEHCNPDEMHTVVSAMENLAIQVYRQKEVLTQRGYTDDLFFALLTIIASVRKEFSEKKREEKDNDYRAKILVLEKEIKRIKVAANIIFAQQPTRLQEFSLVTTSETSHSKYLGQQVDFSSAM